MKIVCTALVLMLVASYGCITDNLAAEDDTAQAVVIVEDVVVEEQVDVLSLSDTEAEENEVQESNADASADSLFHLDMGEVLTLDEDAAVGGLESDPTSFFTPEFRYVPPEPF
jgi:hypothetical protein